MKNIREILTFTGGMRRYFVLITASSIVGAILNLATPFIIRDATNVMVAIVAHKQDFSFVEIGLLALAILIVNVLSTAFSDVGGYFGDLMAVKVRQQLSKSYYKHLMSLPQRYYDSEVTGKIINRLSRAIADISQFLNFFANNLLQTLLTVIISVAVMVYYSWPLAILTLSLIPVYLLLAKRSSTKWQDLEHEKNHNFDIASGRFAEVVGQMRLVKSFGTERTELDSFDGRMGTMVGLTKQQSRHWHTRNAERGLLLAVIYSAMFGILFFQTAKGMLSIGDMVLLITLINQVRFPLQSMSFFVDMYQRAAANSKDFVEAMHELPEPDETGIKNLVIKHGKVEYRDIHFSYEGENRVLEAISFTIEPGQKLALVGESGGGKTTISNLLMQLYRPDSGEILVDGQPISEVTRASLRSQIATVFQEAALFSGTIKENISYANPKATEKQIIAAAKAANAYGFITKLEKGFDAEIGERGIKLSGGQKQRIAIARAVLKDAPILILDEATSSLDSRAEHEVQQALDRLMKDRTVLIIAHRLSTIANVDTIVTLRNGQVDEIGTPAQLSQTDGIYADLLSLQVGDSDKARKALKAFDMSR